MFRQIVSAFVAGLALASAYTQPVGDPSGNPIATPGLNQIVPVGTPFQVTWNPTTQGTVSIVLLRGPSSNVLPLYAIANSIENTGSFSWTPSTDLDDDTTHYGLQLIVDATGQYQYSTQFGISNPAKRAGSSSSSASMTMTSSGVLSSVTSSPASMSMSITSSAPISSSAPASSSMSTSSGIASTVIISVVTSTSGQSTVTSTASVTSASTTSAKTTSSSPAVVTNNGAASNAVLSFGGAAAVVLAAVAAY